METVLIFGATGGIGAYTALHLKEKKYNVIAVGNRKSDNGFFQQYDIEYYSVDIANFDSFSILPDKNIDVVINFAGVLPARNYDPRMFIN